MVDRNKERERPDQRKEDAWARDDSYQLGAFDLNLELVGQLPPNLVGRWFAHEKDRIAKAMQVGYRPVTMDTDGYHVDVAANHTDFSDGWVQKTTGRQESGSPQVSYLMAIKKEWFDADQQSKAAKIKGQHDAIKDGQLAVSSEKSMEYLGESNTISRETFHR